MACGDYKFDITGNFVAYNTPYNYNGPIIKWPENSWIGNNTWTESNDLEKMKKEFDALKEQLMAVNSLKEKEISVIGSATEPATQEEIAAIQKALSETANDPNMTLLCEHSFSLEDLAKAFAEIQTEIENDLNVSAPIDAAISKEEITNQASKDLFSSRPRNHIGYTPKRVTSKHTMGGYKPNPVGSPIASGNYGGIAYSGTSGVGVTSFSVYQVPKVQEPKLKSFEGTVFGRVEISE